MRADIHDGQEHKRSVQGPDTEAQDLSHLQIITFRLQRAAGPYRSAISDIGALRPPGWGPCSRVPVPCYMVISIINREVPSCELPASCLRSSRCWLSPVLL